ncbi:MAG: hypothetical protein II440_03625 [Clostridia bacterium]|nr:hypothetical protein [Clostridia bacterium]
MKNTTAISNEEIIAALISSGTITQAAAQLNISTRTIYDRMTQKDFKAAYSAAKSDILRKAVLKLNTRLNEAIDTVSTIMNDKEVNAAVRLQAAQTLINTADKFTQRLQAEEINIENYSKKELFDLDFI